MGIMVSNDLNQKSELNRRISSDLRARAASMESIHETDFDDEDPDMKPTSKFAWAWIVLIVLAVIALFCILFI